MDLRQCAQQVLTFGLGQVRGDRVLQQPPFRFDRLLQRTSVVGEPEPDQAVVPVVPAPDEQAGLGYPGGPVGPGRAAPIDPADIAAVAALALTQEGHQGKEYVLTGDEAFTVAEQVQILAKALGRDIEVREVVTPAEAVRFRYPTGAPPALADAIIEGLRLMRADTVGLRTDTARQLLGRRPRTFTDWCARNASAFPSRAPHDRHRR